MTMTFTKATKTQARARVALVGPAGSGKTFTALRVARGLAGPDGRIAVIDTEHGSAAKYADRFDFDALALTTFAPATYIEAIGAAEAAGYDVLIVDSLSHAWIGVGGALDQVDKAAKRSRTGNTFTAWRDVTPQHNALVEAMLQCGCHLIVTMRAKTEYVLEADSRGKQVPRKVGMAPVQRDGVEYEFDIVADLTVDDHTLIVSKTRCEALDGATMLKPGEDLGETIRSWLTDGAPAPAAPERAQPSTNGHAAPAPAPPQEFHATPLVEALTTTEAGVEVLKEIWRHSSGHQLAGGTTLCLERMADLAGTYQELAIVADAFEKAKFKLTAEQQGKVGAAIGAAKILVDEALADDEPQEAPVDWAPAAETAAVPA